MKLKTRVSRIKKKIEALHTELLLLQESCSHEHVTKKPWRDDGYAEPTRYYYDITCNECGKTWTVEQ